MNLKKLMKLYITLLISLIGVYSKEDVKKNFVESQITRNYSVIEQNDVTRSLLSLNNIQIDIWSDTFSNGFSSVEFEDENVGIFHRLNNNTAIELGNDKYVIVSNNMPNHDSLILFYEDTYDDLEPDNLSSMTSKGFFIITNETGNEISISSDKLSNGFICMGILNGTEIWSREFCEMSQIAIDNTVLTCNCKGSYIYSIVESQSNMRILQIQTSNFNFPELNVHSKSQVNHAGGSYINRVTRNEDHNSNHGNDVPFPPLHGSIGGKNGAFTMNKEEHNITVKDEELIPQYELIEYYQLGPVTKYVRTNPDSHNFNRSKLIELNNKASTNKELNEINHILNNYNTHTKENIMRGKTEDPNVDSNNKEKRLHPSQLLGPRVDSVTVSMELKNINQRSLNSSKARQNFSNKFIDTLSRALNIMSNKLMITKIWNESEVRAIRGADPKSVGVTVNIKTSEADVIIHKVKDLHNKVCEFNQIFQFKLLSISKNAGAKSISNEIITEKPEKKNEVISIETGVSHTLPIIFTLDLKTRRPFMNEKEAFTLLEDDLSRLLKIPKFLIDIPEFTYRHVNESITNEVFLVIHTEIWVHPVKPQREDYRTLLSNLYSSIIHSKNSSFSKIFICYKHEIKEVPHIKHQEIQNEQTQSDEISEYRSSEKRTGRDTKENPFDQGRISKIGKSYNFNQGDK
ncbi:erythrocyte membrane-associated antigen [Cryptosporidium felis]|nr:erythrocyte membrane-associated antigen [Cryptosporidium felis]